MAEIVKNKILVNVYKNMADKFAITVTSVFTFSRYRYLVLLFYYSYIRNVKTNLQKQEWYIRNLVESHLLTVIQI